MWKSRPSEPALSEVEGAALVPNRAAALASEGSLRLLDSRGGCLHMSISIGGERVDLHAEQFPVHDVIERGAQAAMVVVL
jgi:hypothetical protein